MALCRYRSEAGESVWGWIEDGRVLPVAEADVIAVCAEPGPEGLAALRAVARQGGSVTLADLQERGALLAPVLPTQEVWAAGVTYESSKFARMAESEHASDLYAKVYVADRPELFLKATPNRVVGSGGALRIRADSGWNVPEPELAALVAANGRILGYTVGNDMSSRDIEGANALYLPQAKVYRACCGLGPVVVPAEQVSPQALPIALRIAREGREVYSGETNTARMKRAVAELVPWLFRENEFARGVFLLTGTGIVPDESFTLHPGDSITIEIGGIGALTNSVIQGDSQLRPGSGRVSA